MKSAVDLIIVLQDGRVVEEGTHDELLRQGGLYHSMWLQQASSETFAEDRPTDLTT
jgi:ABC transporter ATM